MESWRQHGHNLHQDQFRAGLMNDLKDSFLCRSYFQELLDFIREYKFERLGAFIYSPEEGTRAFNYTPQVPPAEKEGRFKKLMSLQKEISEEVNRDLLGKEMEILIDEQDTEDRQLFIGRSEGDAPEVDGQVYLRTENKNINPGNFVKVKIIDTLEYDLLAEEVD